ncbi:membrane progestin receptor alpha-B-like [Saccostrea echinata]|uniref:membrane progestin receptor alpha-B-like n=1 Tax=Saccostrea echinata TaxID=191078 RepID=UPI002A7F974E|nr:membrane progestin receptor alpha-B-like [Saccostrea echinata]
MVVKYLQGLPKTVSTKEIPSLYHEPHIEEGYRQNDLPWIYYISSLFQMHNETVNVWTHLIGFVVCVYSLLSFQQSYDLITDPYMWPLVAGYAGMSAMFLFSACAHLLANTSSVVHYTGFGVDYAGLSLYGIGSVLLHFNYAIHHSAKGSFIQEYSVPIGVILAICVCICGCVSKFSYSRPYPFQRKLWIIIPVGLVFVLVEIPIIHRLYLYSSHEIHDESLVHHIGHMTLFITAAFFFGSHIPERWYPGRFDLIGHSHQIFHVFIVLVAVEQTNALRIDIANLTESGIHHLTGSKSTFSHTFGVILFVLLVDICSVYYFHTLVKERERKSK